MIRNGSVVVAVAAVAHCRPKLSITLMPEKDRRSSARSQYGGKIR
ncbi:hypothetical protein SAMCFNEI73_Ch3622 [Sinorhizobium americanum]|uniref:Uncharacterized protein n=1 Tax=Sinorhizobium americanum TaxID=194963 RepID=A0A1L3LS17_9HYPH|nr:hypothetical protein SAMCFNEI73_Ch3622 [Sinorhizobium americanum]